MPGTEFILLAAAMVIAAMALIVIPLVRRGDPSPIAAGALVAVVPLVAVLLYFAYSNWPWDAQPGRLAEQPHSDQAASLLEMIDRLELKLQDNPDDVEGWQMLGRTYGVMERYPDALEAYARSRDLSDDQDVNALTGYAEALAMVRGGVVDDEIAALFEKALLISPDDRKGLWYGGLAAFELGRLELARSRWQQLLTLDPPEQMASLLREQIASVDVTLGNTSTPAALSPPATAPEVPAAAVSGGLALTVSIAPELAGRARPDAPVFILARQAGVPGPPLAVVRKRVADLPLQLVLTDANAMSPGNVLSAHENVEVVARVSLGGTPTAQTGDLSGSKMVASNGSAAIVIDSVVQN